MARLDLYTAATDWPVSIATAAEHLRVVDSAEDLLIERLIKAATERLQKRHFTQFCDAVYDEYFDGFPGGSLTLRLNPIGAEADIASVKYIDPSGTTQTAAATIWELGREDGRAVVRLSYGQSWPGDCRGDVDSVVVRYTAGYGAQSDVPEAVVDAVLIEVAELYLIRDPIMPDRSQHLDHLTDNLMAGYSYRTTGRR